MDTKSLTKLFYGNSNPYFKWNGGEQFPIYDRYLHTHITDDLIDHLLDTCPNNFWLEVGSMYGGSAIKTAQRMRTKGANMPILCVDPFCGDVSMWEINAEDPELLGCEGSRITILDKFLGNVIKADVQEMIVPLAVTGTVGMRLLERFLEDGKIEFGPGVIYLDSAHEWDETYIELKTAWRILAKGGCIAGDDLDWPAVAHDLHKFSEEVGIDIEERPGGQWLVRKPLDHPHLPSPFFETNKVSTERTERDFDKIYERELWGYEGNGSGTGSMMHTTVAVRELFVRLIEEEGVRTIVDVSAGGMLWWPEVLERYPDVKFYGYDISKIKTEENRAKFAHRKNWEFHVGDVTNTAYPSCDLIICRHTLNHLSVTDVIISMENLRKSDARMLAVTQHEVDDLYNETLIADGTVGCIDYRPIDLRKSPLDMPAPFIEIDDADAEDVQMDWKRKFLIWKGLE